MSCYKKIGLVVISAALTACGGGDGDASSNANINPTETSQLIHGGTVVTPTLVSFSLKNEIKSDIFENYFKVTVSAEDTIVIKSTLKDELEARLHTRCIESTGDYTISINNDIKSCSLDMKYTFKSAGDYILHFKYPRNYPQNNSGYFDIALIPAKAIFSPSNFSTGKPNNPRTIITGGADNSLSANDFYNNFVYDAQSGDTLHIQTYPNTIPTAIDGTRCKEHWSKYDGYSPKDGYFTYGVLTSDLGEYNCAETFEHRYEKAGRYYLNIRFMHGAQGFFRAVVVKGI